MVTRRLPWHMVKPSSLHGNGVFAARDIPAGTRILEYAGRRLSPEQADARHPVNPEEPFHTFFFAISSGKIIDGGQRGNDSRWINHCCEPNCEGHENTEGTRVFIVAMRDIAQGEELLYDYALVIDEEITPELQQNYRCLCGVPSCRGTMIALPEPVNKRDAAAQELREAAAELMVELDLDMEQARQAPLEATAPSDKQKKEKKGDKKKKTKREGKDKDKRHKKKKADEDKKLK